MYFQDQGHYRPTKNDTYILNLRPVLSCICKSTLITDSAG